MIDDESGIRDVVAEVLQDEGYAVDTAPNGAAALALLNKPGQPAPDLILLDMRMPEMNGWEFAEAYRQRPGPHAPIATLTAAIDASRYAAEIGADGFLGKPFEVDALLALVERLSSQR
ncbi:MAG: response regulator [Chloroflexi bacterium]|nr:response regulator [Chloroflexota bacterium]